MPAQTPPDPLSKRRLKLWIRMLAVTRSVEAELRDVLRRQHGTTLPRFDVMAALARRDGPVPMGSLAAMLLVSNGNATDVVTRLEAEGLVRRSKDADDRRSIRVGLTEAGRAAFAAMAAGHEAALDRILAPLGEADLDALRDGLRKVSPRRET